MTCAISARMASPPVQKKIPPSIVDIDVFGCEVDLIRLDTQQPLRDPIRDILRKRNRF